MRPSKGGFILRNTSTKATRDKGDKNT